MSTTTAPAPARRGRGYGAVLRVPGMRAIATAHTVSMVGTVAAEVALSILVYQRTASPLLSALVLACSFVPYSVGGTLLSGVVDRFPARRVLVTCDVASAALVAAMLLPGVPVGVLLLLLVALGTVAPVFQGARAASLVHLLDADGFPVGRSLIRTIGQSAVLVGFAAGAVVVAAVGTTWMLAADVASFLASAALLRSGTPWTPPGGDDGERGPRAVLRASADGLRHIATHPRLRALLLLTWFVPMFGAAADGLAVAYTTSTGAASTSAGALFTGYAVGLVAGEVVVARCAPVWRRRLVLPLVVVSQVPLVAFAAHPSLVVAAVLLAVAGSGHSYMLGTDPLLLEAADPEYRGRVFTVLTSGLMTLQGAGIAVAGALGTVASPAWVVAGFGVVGLAASLVTARVALRGAG